VSEVARIQPRVWLGFALALGVGVLGVFSGVLELGAVEYDDPDYVTRNDHVRAGLTWEGLRWAVGSSFAANWFPLTWLSHMLDYQLYGDDLGRFHATSVVLHLVNTLLLFALLGRTTGRAGRSALVAALFALHPLHVETVVWLSERKGLLSSLFALAAMHAYVGYVRAPSRVRRLGVVVCFACGLASKPMVVTLPFVLLLLDVWPLERLDRARLLAPASSLGERLRESGLLRLVIEKWPLFALSALGIAITLQVQEVAVVGLDRLSLSQRAAGAGIAYWKYLGLTLWPAGLTPIHLHPGAAISPVVGALGMAGVIGLTAAALGALRERPEWTVGWLWFVGMLVPVVGFVQVGSAIVAERYSYLPLIGLFVAAVWGIADGVAVAARRRAVAVVLALAVLLGCSVASYARVADWRDTVTLFGRAVALHPTNHLAHVILGLGYARTRQDDLAIEHYRRAAELRREHHTALYRIGRRLARKADLERAERAFEIELALAPEFVPARHALALLRVEQGRPAEARSEFERVLEIAPNPAITHENLGKLDLMQGADPAAARPRLERAVELAPERVSARLTLAQALVATGEREAAVRQLEAARAIAPANRRVLEALARLREGRAP